MRHRLLHSVPVVGLSLPHVIEDAEARQVACRAYNMFYAEVCRKYSDRLTPAAVVPIASPTEALEELEHAVEQLGLGVVMLQGYVTRPVEAYRTYPPPVSIRRCWLDVFGMARRARFYRGGDQSPRKPRRTVWRARRGADRGKSHSESWAPNKRTNPPSTRSSRERRPHADGCNQPEETRCHLQACPVIGTPKLSNLFTQPDQLVVLRAGHPGPSDAVDVRPLRPTVQ